ncbi:hypothetical protein GR160_11645 [Flavobacterium sp. Sd200]|uniref:hypothetical protein n=1 Tax=Flavobacterium sp. Sd200 TaxID=2692211 RepID=UPI00136BE9C2|nr:hypothetical protein [Flavobacterium sp. Sd200]MXN91876.1 hypothetical protein [Flavobacterium sp. Sd200]
MLTKKLDPNTEIKNNLESLRNGMIEYIKFSSAKYTQKDVEKCIILIENFLDNIAKSENKKKGMELVKTLIIQLNDLNQKCEGTLIETEQREEISTIIILAGHLKGYNSKDEDITYKMRKW